MSESDTAFIVGEVLFTLAGYLLGRAHERRYQRERASLAPTPLYAEDFFRERPDGKLECPGCGAIQQDNNFIQHLKADCPTWLASTGAG